MNTKQIRKYTSFKTAAALNRVCGRFFAVLTAKVTSCITGVLSGVQRSATL